MWKTVRQLLQQQNVELSHDLEILPLEILKGVESRDSEEYLHRSVQSKEIHNRPKVETTQTSIDEQIDKHDIYTQWNIIQSGKGVKFLHVLKYGWTLR